MRALHSSRTMLLAGVLVLAAGCAKKEAPPADVAPPAPAAVALKVTGVDLGKSLNADKSIANSTDDFRPGDTVYVSVATEGSSAGATLMAKWSFENGQVIDSTSQSVAPTGPARTEFHIMKASGWPAGKYKVEIMLDGAAAGSKEFEVKRG